MPLLEQKLEDSNNQLCFLMKFATLSALDTKLNADTIQWFNRMPLFFNKHHQIISEKTTQYQSGLQVRFQIYLPYFFI